MSKKMTGNIYIFGEDVGPLELSHNTFGSLSCIATQTLLGGIFYLFLTVLGLRRYMGFSLVAKSGGYSLVTVRGPLAAVTSLDAESTL